MDKHADHEHSLERDLITLRKVALNRRELMRWAFGAGAASLLAACESTISALDTDNSGSSSAGAGAADGGSQTSLTDAGETCSTIPEETAGPYPADGSNGASGGGGPGQMQTTSSGAVINALALTGIVRSDIRSSFAGATGVAEGVPLTVTLKVVDISDNCSPLAGFAVYIWHCDRGGNYSLYSAAVSTENYLRGVQETDDDGTVTFTTIFPACYSGRWPHIHFEVYPSLDSASGAANKLATSQLALPGEACDLVFAETGYEDSIRNFSQITLASDNVFSDGVSLQTPTLSGSVSAGYSATLTVGVKPS